MRRCGPSRSRQLIPGKEDQIGSIAPGKIANFTVLEKDPYEVSPITLKDVPVWGTVFEGRIFPVPEGMPCLSEEARFLRRAGKARLG